MGGRPGDSINTKKLGEDTIPKLRKGIEKVYGVGMAETALNYIFSPDTYPGDEQLYQFRSATQEDEDDADSDL